MVDFPSFKESCDVLPTLKKVITKLKPHFQERKLKVQAELVLASRKHTTVKMNPSRKHTTDVS